LNTKQTAATGLIAALYIALTLLLAPISFGAIQFRLSELLVLLIFIDRAYMPGLLIGCAIANIFSPLGPIDVFFGTLSTFAASLLIMRCKKLFTATLMPVLACVIIGAEMYIAMGLPFIFSALTVMAGEFCVCTLLGYPIFKFISKNAQLLRILKISEIKRTEY